MQQLKLQQTKRTLEMLIKHFPTILKIFKREKKWIRENAHLLPKAFPGPSKHVVWFSTTFCAIKSLGIAKFWKFWQLKKSHLLLQCIPGKYKKVIWRKLFFAVIKSLPIESISKKSVDKKVSISSQYPSQAKIRIFCFFPALPPFFCKVAVAT